MKRHLAAVAALVAALGIHSLVASSPADSTAVIQLVTQVQRADYEGDRAALKRLYAALEPYSQSQQIASRVHYWRGFALWRRAMNGFNERVAPTELRDDLEQALVEFQKSAAEDPNFADAYIAAGSCLSNLTYLNRSDPERLKQLIPEAQKAMQQAKTLAPDNPRFYWVQGPNLWYAPPERAGGQEKAVKAYEKGLALAKQAKNQPSDPLDPSWGEPELLMNLAWSNLHLAQPNLPSAQTYAQAALTLVPYWHYVRDILLPQIQTAVDTAAIQRMRDKDIAASKSGDFASLSTLFTDDAVVMPPGSGFVRGRTERDATMAKMRDTISQYEVLEYREDFDELKILGSEAVEWGTISGKMKNRKTGAIESSAYKVMRVLSKQPDGELLISRSIFNDMPVAASPRIARSTGP